MRQTVQDSNAGAYGSANASMRAVSKASAAYKNDSWDVVDAVKEKNRPQKDGTRRIAPRDALAETRRARSLCSQKSSRT
ncbi:MAG: hypothetical protein IPL33_16270 [Sphingobacteriales bacterium]|nr:hypothetical protein [Sphingobacteriales bacterium]